MLRSHSALGRLEGPRQIEEASNGTRQRRQRRQSATGPLRRGVHHVNRTTQSWASSLRQPSQGDGGQIVLEEWPRNCPHPSETFLLRQMPATRQTATLGDSLLRHTTESFYQDYSSSYSNNGDMGTEVLTQLVKLPFEPENYRKAAAKEVAYNPPYPYRLMYDEASNTERPSSSSRPSSHGFSAKTPNELPLLAKRSETTPLKLDESKDSAHKMRKADKGEDEVLRSTFKDQALPGVEKWLKSAGAEEKRIAVEALRKATGKQLVVSSKPGVQKEMKTVRVQGSPADIGDTVQPGVSTQSTGHHHHHHTSGSCARCERRRIHRDYTSLSGSTRLRQEVQQVTLPGNPPPPRTLQYRIRVGNQHDPKTNAETCFLSSQPPHRSHFAIAPDWPSEMVDRQLSVKGKVGRR